MAHLGEITSNQGVEKTEELEADLGTFGGEARARGAREALGGNGDGAFADGVARERGRKRVDERWVSAGRRGVHANAVDLTSGANAGVRVPNGSQVSRWATTTASSALIQTKR